MVDSGIDKCQLRAEMARFLPFFALAFGHFGPQLASTVPFSQITHIGTFSRIAYRCRKLTR